MEQGPFKFFVTPFRHPSRWLNGSNPGRVRQPRGATEGGRLKEKTPVNVERTIKNASQPC